MLHSFWPPCIIYMIRQANLLIFVPITFDFVLLADGNTLKSTDMELTRKPYDQWVKRVRLKIEVLMEETVYSTERTQLGIVPVRGPPGQESSWKCVKITGTPTVKDKGLTTTIIMLFLFSVVDFRWKKRSLLTPVYYRCKLYYNGKSTCT